MAGLVSQCRRIVRHSPERSLADTSASLVIICRGKTTSYFPFPTLIIPSTTSSTDANVLIVKTPQATLDPIHRLRLNGISKRTVKELFTARSVTVSPLTYNRRRTLGERSRTSAMTLRRASSNSANLIGRIVYINNWVDFYSTVNESSALRY